MASTTKNTTTGTPNQKADTALNNDGVKSIADALAALPKETEQTMKGFLEQQMANSKNANDELVEQFGSAIDNSEFASSMNEVKEYFRKEEKEKAENKDNEKQQEFLANIQNDLDKILEAQGEVLRAEVTRDEPVAHDADLNEVEKSDEKADEETDTVKEDIKPVEVKVGLQMPEMENDDAAGKEKPEEPSKEETLLTKLVSAQEEQSTLLEDIGKKLPDADEVNKEIPEKQESEEPNKDKNLLNDIVLAQTEQNELLADIGKKLPDVEENKEPPAEETLPKEPSKEPPVDENLPKEPSKEETLLGDLVSAQVEQNTLLNDIGEKLAQPADDIPEPKEDIKDVPNETAERVVEVNDSLGKINDNLDSLLEQFGESVANTDVNEPQPINVQVNLDNKEPEREKVPDEQADMPKKVELAEESLNRLHEYVDAAKQNEDDLVDSISKQVLETTAKQENEKKDTLAELMNDISGANDAMNNQDDTPLPKPKEDVPSETETRLDEQASSERSLQIDEETNAVSTMEASAPVLDRRMEMAAREERDVTPVLNDVQLFNRMSLTNEEIHVLASEIGKAVAENIIDREGDRARDAAYLDEVEKIMRR